MVMGELLEVDNNNGSSLVSKTTYAYDGAASERKRPILLGHVKQP